MFYDLLSFSRVPSPVPGVVLDKSPASWGESFSKEGVKCKAGQGMTGILNGWAIEPYLWVLEQASL